MTAIDKVVQQLELFYTHYKEHKSKLIVDKYIYEAEEVISLSLNYQLMLYRTKQATDKQTSVFLIVPSIFNSPEILFINAKKSFIEHLRDISNVYLIDWMDITTENFSLEHYVLETIEAIKYISSKKVQINLIGHCIGGTIAIAAAILQSSLIKTLTLLTTPWDFSHFRPAVKAYQQLNVDKFRTEKAFLPKIYIQILFFLLAPYSFSDKINKYFDLKLEQDQRIFFEIERWLFSGNQITSLIYSQITDKLVKDNILVNEKWQITDKIISPKNFNKPVFMLGAIDDKLVPTLSMNYLKNYIKNLTYFETKGGHISYIVGNKIEYFVQTYKNWLIKGDQNE